MDVLSFDIGSGGITAARFNENLDVTELREVSWDLHRDAQGRATLSADTIESAFEQAARALSGDAPVAAVSIASFMHSFLILSSCCAPLTPVFTWLDTTAASGLDAVRSRIGDRFHERTGCHYHPMFPVFKLAADSPGRGNRVASPKAFLAWELTGEFVDDFGMAAASGLLNVRSGEWDAEILGIVGLESADFPRLSDPWDVVGAVTDAASGRFGIRSGTPLVSGSGDGFLAAVGSGNRMAVTIGTSGAARQLISKQVLDPDIGAFCYRASRDSFLLGCATSNGGNVLDWAREMFGPMPGPSEQKDIPVFLPWLNGERSFEWNPDLRASWHGLTSQHTAAQLARSAAEGVLFNLAHYVETLGRQPGVVADQIVLSGNGFREPLLAPLLAALVSGKVLLPPDPGLATLRGAAIDAWRALGHDAGPATERILQKAERVKPVSDDGLLSRYERFKELRKKLAAD